MKLSHKNIIIALIQKTCSSKIYEYYPNCWKVVQTPAQLEEHKQKRIFYSKYYLRIT